MKFLNCVRKYINAEEAALDRKKMSKPLHPPREEDSRKRKLNNESSNNNRAQEQKKPRRDPEPKSSRQRTDRYDNYHELTTNMEEVYA